MTSARAATGAPGAGLGRRLVANTLLVASGRVAALLVWLLFTPAILGALGAEAFGVWSLFYAFTGYLASLDVGLVQGTLRHVAAARARGAHEEAGAFGSLALVGFLGLGALWLLLALAFAGPVLAWLRIPPALLPAARFAWLAGPVVFTLGGFANALMAVLQAHGRFDLANVTLLTATAALALAILIVLARGWGLEGLVIGAGVAWGAGVLAGAVLLARAEPGFRWAPPRRALGRLPELLRFGAPMQVTNLLAVGNAQLDKLLLSRFVGLAAVAPYELGWRVATASATLPQMMLAAVLPEASALHPTEGRERMRELHRRGGRYFLAASAVAIAPLLAGADRLYAAWLGPGHADAALVLRGLTLALSTSLATGMGTTLARGLARTDLEAWYAFAAVTVHLGLSLWLLPALGLRGALLAIIAGNLLGAVVFFELLRRLTGWSRVELMVEPLAWPAAATLLGVGAGWGVHLLLPAPAGAAGWAWLALVALASAAVVLGVLFAARYLRWREALALVPAR